MRQGIQQEDRCVFNISHQGELILLKENDIDFLSREDLSQQQSDLYCKWANYNDLATQFFHFYAGIRKSGQEWLLLSFEFFYFKDSEGVLDRSNIYRFVDHLNAKYPIEIGLMDTGVTDHKLAATDERAGQVMERLGKNHGRPFDRIDVSVDLSETKMAKGDTKRLMVELEGEFRVRGLDRLLVAVI